MKVKLLIILLQILKHGSSFICPQGSTQLLNEPICLFPYIEPLFYMDAMVECASIGGSLPMIKDIAENSIIYAKGYQDFNQSAHHLGVRQTLNETWIYVDGSPLTYQNWAQDQPSMSSNSSVCSLIDPITSQWKASDCSLARPFYCAVNITVEPQCPTGWSYLEATGFCYYFQDASFPIPGNYSLFQGFTFFEAENLCQFMDSHLVSIHSKEEDHFVTGIIQQYRQPICNGAGFAWIGYHGTGDVGNGTWTDGTPSDYAHYSTPNFCRPNGGYFVIFGQNSCNANPDWTCTDSADAKYGRFICKRLPLNSLNLRSSP